MVDTHIFVCGYLGPNRGIAPADWTEGSEGVVLVLAKSNGDFKGMYQMGGESSDACQTQGILRDTVHGCLFVFGAADGTSWEDHTISGETGWVLRLGESVTDSGGEGGADGSHSHPHEHEGLTLTVEEADGTPSVTNVTKIKVGNGDLTDEGSGVVRVKTAADATGGGGGGGDIAAARSWLVDNFHPDDYPASPNATYDDEFNDATDMSGAVNGLDARWNWRNQGSATVTFDKAGWLTLSCPSQSSNNWRIIEIAAFADGTYEAKVSMEGTLVNFRYAGIVLVDATNGDFYYLGPILRTGNYSVIVQRWTNVTTFNSNVSDAVNVKTVTYLRVVKAGTTLDFWASVDGIGWKRLATLTDAVGATRIGLGVSEESASGLTKLHVDYFRKVA